MNFWAYVLIGKSGKILARDCGYETQEDASEAAYKKAAEFEGDVAVRVRQVWQELEYDKPMQVVYSDSEVMNGAAVLAGVAFQKEILSLRDGKVQPLGLVQVIDELPWVDLSDSLFGDSRNDYAEYGEVF